MTHPVSGTVDTTPGTTFKKAAAYTCYSGYRLVGTNVRICDSKGNWTDTAPACVIRGLTYNTSKSFFGSVIITGSWDRFVPHHRAILSSKLWATADLKNNWSSVFIPSMIVVSTNSRLPFFVSFFWKLNGIKSILRGCPSARTLNWLKYQLTGKEMRDGIILPCHPKLSTIVLNQYFKVIYFFNWRNLVYNCYVFKSTTFITLALSWLDFTS